MRLFVEEDLQDNERQKGIQISPKQLEKDTLHALIDDFILREGTDYGAQEVSLEIKRQQLLKQIESGHVLIFFDPDRETTTLVSRTDLTNSNQQNWDILS
ncbi:MAG: YheU family protein [Pseudomonadota bacterium]